MAYTTQIGSIGGLGTLGYNFGTGAFGLLPIERPKGDVTFRPLSEMEISKFQPMMEQFQTERLPYIQEQYEAGRAGFQQYIPGVTPIIPTAPQQPTIGTLASNLFLQQRDVPPPVPQIPYTPEQVGTAGQLEEIQNYFTQRYGDELYQQGTTGERAFNEYLGAVLPNIQQQELMNYMQSQTGFGALQPNIPWQPPPQTPYSLEPQQPFGGMGMLAPNAEWLGPTQPTSSGFVPNMEWLGSIQSQAAQQTAPSYSLPGQMAGRPLYDMGGQQQSTYFNPMNNAWNYQQGQSFAQAEPWRSVFA